MGLMPSRAKKLGVLLACSRFPVKLCERMRTVHGSPIAAFRGPQWGVTPSLCPHFPCMRARRHQEAIGRSIECCKGREVGKVPVTPTQFPWDLEMWCFLGRVSEEETWQPAPGADVGDPSWCACSCAEGLGSSQIPRGSRCGPETASSLPFEV